ncbi:unnamed protein product [Aphanomyces euteiches]
MSSFRRAGTAAAAPSSGSSSTAAASSALPRGTKAFLNNQTLVSSGLRELDAWIGGGFVLGTVVTVEPPAFESFGADVLRCFAAEGLVAKQRVYINASSVRESLPLELSTAQKQLKAQLADVKESGDKLKIAWQYEKYAADKQFPIADTRFCHSFDLSKPIQAHYLDTCRVLAAATDYRVTFAVMQQALLDHPNDVVRFVLADIGSPWLYGDMTADHEAHFLQFLRAVRGLMARHRHRAICMMTVPTFAFPAPLVKSVRHLSDYAFEMSSFLGDTLPPELRDFSGLCYVHRLATAHSLTSHVVESVKMGIKRDRRKLKLEHLHLPPEGSRSNKTEKQSTSSAADPLAF